MKKLSYLLLPFIFIGCNANLSYNDEAINFDSNIDSEICESKQEVLLKNLNENIVFIESSCFDNDQSEIITEYQLKDKSSISTFDKKYNEGDSPPSNKAVSTYQSKNYGLTLLSITSWDTCCFPRAEGTFYEIDIYQLHKSNDGYQVSKIPEEQIGFESYGFEGNTFDDNGKSYFKLKTINLIKDQLKNLDF